MSANTRLVRRTDMPCVEVDGEVMIYDAEKGEVLHLDAVGSLLWDLLAEPTELDDLWAAIATAFGIPVGNARNDAGPFLGELTRRRLLVPC